MGYIPVAQEACIHGHSRDEYGYWRKDRQLWQCKECGRLSRLKRLRPTESRRLEYLYGITLDDYEEILDSQGGTCAICGGTELKRLSVDHDHKTGRVRGLLCNRCNVKLSYIEEGSLEDCFTYLKEQWWMCECTTIRCATKVVAGCDECGEKFEIQ